MRILLVGCGSIGERHLRVFRQLGADVIQCEPKDQRLAEMAARYNCGEWYNSLDQADLSSFDAAAICTAPGSHVELAQRLIKAGAHVLIEKSISHTINGVRELIQLAEERRLLIGSVTFCAFIPVWRL